MRIFSAAYYEFKKNIRDIKMLVLLLLFPIVITYILGNAVGGYFEGDTPQRISVGYINKDSGNIGKEFDSFLNNKEVQKKIKISGFNDRQEAQKAIDKGKVDTLIYIPDGLSENILRGNRSNIEIFGKQNVEFVESLAGSFVSNYNTLSAVIMSGGRAGFPTRENIIKRIYFTKIPKMPRIMDYYAVLELLMTIVIGAILGVTITAKNDETDMHIRIYSLPVRKWVLILGKILGSSMFLFVCSIFSMLFTKYVYHANWNGNMFVILGTLYAFSLITIGIGVLLGVIGMGQISALMIILLLMMTFGVVSGAVSPTTTNSLIAMFTPNYHAKILIFGSIYDYPRDVMRHSAMWLLGMILVIYSITAAMIGRRRYGNI